MTKTQSRIERVLSGKTPEEQYDILYWLMMEYGKEYSNSRLARIEWLKGDVLDCPSAQPVEDAVPRTSVEYICQKNTVSTNPYEHKYHDKFIQFMDDPEISDFGRWQFSNGFNTALVAVKCDLDKVPPCTPKFETTEIDAFTPGEWTPNGLTNSPQPEQFNPCTVCQDQEFDCIGCKFRRT